MCCLAQSRVNLLVLHREVCTFCWNFVGNQRTVKSFFRHAPQPWTYLEIIYLEKRYWDCKCLNQFDRTFNGLYPASSLVKKVCVMSDWVHVRIEQIIVQAIHSEQVGVLIFLSCNWHKTGRIQISMGHEEESCAQRRQGKCLTEETTRLCNFCWHKLMPKSLDKFKEQQETWLFMAKLQTGASRSNCGSLLHHIPALWSCRLAHYSSLIIP